MTMQYRALRIQERDANSDGVYTALAYAAGTTDTYNTTMTADAFAGVTLDDFRILLYHEHDEDPIGKPVALRSTPAGLEVDFVFADTERAQEVRALVDGGFLRAVSAGFIPVEWYDREDGVRVYTRCELHELSIVNVPSSKGAKIKLARELGLDDMQMRDLGLVISVTVSDNDDDDCDDADDMGDMGDMGDDTDSTDDTNTDTTGTCNCDCDACRDCVNKTPQPQPGNGMEMMTLPRDTAATIRIEKQTRTAQMLLRLSRMTRG